MDILALINFAAPLIIIFLTKILKRWVSSKWAPLLVFVLGGISTLIGVGPSPGADWIDKIINTAYVSGGATLMYDMFKKIKSTQIPKNLIIICLLLPAVCLLPSCATFESTTYKTMFTLGTTYDAAMKSAGELYKQGRLTQDDVQQIIQFSEIYYTAYQEACIAFEIYKKTKSVEDKGKLDRALFLASDKYREIIGLIERLKLKR